MSEAVNQQEEAQIEPLSEESLEDVSGGICSLANCSGGGNAIDL